MYSKLPNLVLGFHGCDISAFNAVIHDGQHIKPSKNDYDWLGHGAYFWEHNLRRAQDWAIEQQGRGSIEQPAVIGAVLDLGHCLNLTDSEYIDLLKNEYKLLRDEMKTIGQPLPKNSGKTEDRLFRRLDCAVIEHLHSRLKTAKQEGLNLIEPFDSARGLFSEGSPIYEDAGFREKTHIQICVRNPNCIKGYFDPRKPSAKWSLP